MEISIVLFLSVFLAGVLMFLAPCTLPLVPAFLAFISGTTPRALGEAGAQSARKQVVVNAVAFVVGFSLVFILFGAVAGLFGSFVGQFRSVLAQVGGIAIIAFGLMMLNMVSVQPLMRDRRVPVPDVITPGKPASALLIGVIFALGWTPCVGPILASVLLLASTSTTLLEGVALLALFSFGMSLPFILTAVLYERASSYIETHSGVTKWIRRIGGLFLIGIGVLLVMDSFGLTVEYGYHVFRFLGLESLFDLY